MHDCEHIPGLTGSLDEEMALAIRFHGHLGPYLVFGLRMGRIARRLLNFDSHFAPTVVARCGRKTPRSCLADGLQISTGATLGKGGIHLEEPGEAGIEVVVTTKTGRVELALTPRAAELASGLGSWREAETRGAELNAMTDEELFTWTVAETG